MPACRRWVATTAAGCCFSGWEPAVGSALIADRLVLSLDMGRIRVGEAARV